MPIMLPKGNEPESRGLIRRGWSRGQHLARLLGGKQLREMLLSVLLTCLSRLADFCADTLPFVIFVILDCAHEGLALILSKLGIVHILVPMLLNTTFRSCWESLGNLRPAITRVPHLFQP